MAETGAREALTVVKEIATGTNPVVVISKAAERVMHKADELNEKMR
jgi:hypothetical protein